MLTRIFPKFRIRPPRLPGRARDSGANEQEEQNGDRREEILRVSGSVGPEMRPLHSRRHLVYDEKRIQPAGRSGGPETGSDPWSPGRAGGALVPVVRPARPAAGGREGDVGRVPSGGGQSERVGRGHRRGPRRKTRLFSLTFSATSTLPETGYRSLVLEKDEPLLSEHRGILRPNAVMQSSNRLAALFEHEGQVRDEPHSMPSISARIVARSLKLRHDRQTAANRRKKGRVSVRLFSGRILVSRRSTWLDGGPGGGTVTAVAARSGFRRRPAGSGPGLGGVQAVRCRAGRTSRPRSCGSRPPTVTRTRVPRLISISCGCSCITRKAEPSGASRSRPDSPPRRVCGSASGRSASRPRMSPTCRLGSRRSRRRHRSRLAVRSRGGHSGFALTDANPAG